MTGLGRLAYDSVRRRSVPGRIRALGVDVHFQPDALTVDGTTVLSAIAATGRWRTQFVTGTSNGGLSAVPGGDRMRWESRLFDGVYDGSGPEERPAYGALRRERDPYGSAPRFGSAYLRLGPGVFPRTTVCYPDSVFEPEGVGTVDRAGAVLLALDRVHADDLLDAYVEAHVHGGVLIDRDVDAVVLDPSHRGSGVGKQAADLGVPVEWHPGYVLRGEDLLGLDAYRGSEAVRAARRIASDAPLTPLALGIARRAGGVDPPTAKLVWHLLARFGRTDAGPV